MKRSGAAASTTVSNPVSEVINFGYIALSWIHLKPVYVVVCSQSLLMDNRPYKTVCTNSFKQLLTNIQNTKYYVDSNMVEWASLYVS